MTHACDDCEFCTPLKPSGVTERFLPPHEDCTVVVAANGDDAASIELIGRLLPRNCTISVFDKGTPACAFSPMPDIECEPLPNVGREQQTYA
eukprot:5629995-Prymnesium_polylepis.1